MVPIAKLDECFFAFPKGLWHTKFDHWRDRHTQWILIAFPWPTELVRGVLSRPPPTLDLETDLGTAS
jgi:hypothetical protein